MTTISWNALVREAERDFYEKSLRPWVYKFGQVSDTGAIHQGQSKRGRLVVQGEAQPGEAYPWNT